MDNPAGLSDMEARWTSSTPLPEHAALTRLAEAWRALQDAVPSLVTRIDAGEQDVALVVDVLCAAAYRVLINPEGHTQESVSIDDYARSWQLGQQTQSADLYFTRAELARVSPSASAAAFTVRPGFPRKSCWAW